MPGQSAIDGLWKSEDGASPPQLSDILGHIQQFLDVVGYTKTSSALSKELARNGTAVDSESDKSGTQLLQLYQQWHSTHDSHLTPAASESTSDSDTSSSGSDSDSDDESEADGTEGVLVDVEAEETSDDDSDENSESSGDDSDSDSDGSSVSSSAGSVRAGNKRKRAASSDSSDDDTSSSEDSDSSDGSDVDSARPAKRAKTTSESRDSDTKDDSSDSESSSAGSDSSSSSDSDSDSDSTSEDDSSDEEDEEPPADQKPDKQGKKGKSKKAQRIQQEVGTSNTADAARDAGSLSSVTLDLESPADNETPGQIHPDRLKHLPADQRGAGQVGNSKKEVAELKKQQQVPFSRIPADQKVDARFASNAYVPYDYAERAHRDLIVTKGKGFTKEKNKKKRGSYRGGAIDLTPKGIKFDD